ncbi:unnamed protein product [Didymodactylos carnosus]|uniref:Uncharacterized protein n=1 Tax=Didymodactylos carnosus TaxID=1234261 RepID=A0A814I525_9BILA|nr:unnamed protein product [Didymodactylos carnosus]CAF1019665.1 unnamed protein product [Didymodactylos carnosus]CAF3583320.1 unnamed protein product [Didymodactylos carnosus]CAF3791114.1 unnamed protein product [Didymodactylos carnosus]
MPKRSKQNPHLQEILDKRLAVDQVDDESSSDVSSEDEQMDTDDYTAEEKERFNFRSVEFLTHVADFFGE